MRIAGLLAAITAVITAVMLAGMAGTAQDGQDVGFDVRWVMENEADDQDQQCRWQPTESLGKAMDQPVYTDGLPGTVTITDASGEIVHIAELAGTYLDAQSCILSVDATVPDSLAYTIRVNGAHAATVPGDALDSDARPVVILLD